MHTTHDYYVTTAILGGGLSGLTLARLLHERGEQIVVLEAGQIGGLCRSRKEKGFTFDTGGSHIIFSKDDDVLTFMRRMIAGNEQRNDRNTKIFYKQRYVKYPFENGLHELPECLRADHKSGRYGEPPAHHVAQAGAFAAACSHIFPIDITKPGYQPTFKTSHLTPPG